MATSSVGRHLIVKALRVRETREGGKMSGVVRSQKTVQFDKVRVRREGKCCVHDRRWESVSSKLDKI